MPHVDKVIVTNLGALREKYLKRFPSVLAAIRTMTAPDAYPALTTRLVALDDSAAMRPTRGRAV